MKTKSQYRSVLYEIMGLQADTAWHTFFRIARRIYLPKDRPVGGDNAAEAISRQGQNMQAYIPYTCQYVFPVPACIYLQYLPVYIFLICRHVLAGAGEGGWEQVSQFLNVCC